MSRHVNIGTWNLGIKRMPPKLQVIFWESWKGVRWHRWQGGIDTILRGSLLLGFIELRFWRRPVMSTVISYPEKAEGGAAPRAR